MATISAALAIALAHHQAGRLQAAEMIYRQILEVQPNHAESLHLLGVLAHQVGQDAAAVPYLERAIASNPTEAVFPNSLGAAYRALGKIPEAVACYRRALELKPDFAEAEYNLGIALNHQGNCQEAVACYRRALELKPGYIEAYNNLGNALKDQGKPDEAVTCYRKALELKPDFADAHSNLLLALQYCAGATQAGLAKDDLTHRFQAAATQWRDVPGMSDQQLAQQIRADQVDILFDLAGHTAHNRLLVFARKPAPVQITWIGYEGTTGLAAMDYLLADRHVVPPGSEHYYREKVLRMPDGYLCYDPPASTPPAGPPPSLRNGYPTFGSFNNPAKITPEVLAVWAEILRRAPSARLVLKYPGLDDPSLKRRYRDSFVAHGVEPERVAFLPASTYTEYLATYQQVDVALDPFPFSGSVTTCEALWMGVPVISFPRETFASRHSLSHLSNVGLAETIARDLDEYVELAAGLAGDLPRLAALRAGLRGRMAASPLCDGKRFAASLVSLLRGVWKSGLG